MHGETACENHHGTKYHGGFSGNPASDMWGIPRPNDHDYSDDGAESRGRPCSSNHLLVALRNMPNSWDQTRQQNGRKHCMGPAAKGCPKFGLLIPNGFRIDQLGAVRSVTLSFDASSREGAGPSTLAVRPNPLSTIGEVLGRWSKVRWPELLRRLLNLRMAAAAIVSVHAPSRRWLCQPVRGTIPRRTRQGLLNHPPSRVTPLKRK